MKNLIRAEELFMCIGALFLIRFLPINLSWWAYAVLFFAPDLGMIGYLISTQVGAATYNLFHHKGVAVAIGLLGLILMNNYIILAGLILFAHSSFDRVFGFGLKYPDNFKNTSLGWMK
jgi:hypothetical protein